MLIELEDRWTQTVLEQPPKQTDNVWVRLQTEFDHAQKRLAVVEVVTRLDLGDLNYLNPKFEPEVALVNYWDASKNLAMYKNPRDRKIVLAELELRNLSSVINHYNESDHISPFFAKVTLRELGKKVVEEAEIFDRLLENRVPVSKNTESISGIEELYLNSNNKLIIARESARWNTAIGAIGPLSELKVIYQKYANEQIRKGQIFKLLYDFP
ncbi:MAG: hypothetical protein AAB656_00815 [Patescibacteria group bacterium]